jgi:hypothetical protein
MGVGVQGFSHRMRRHFLLNLKAAAAVLTAPVKFYVDMNRFTEASGAF